MTRCKCGRAIWTFRDAVKAMPACLKGYDPLAQTTLNDLLFLAITEIDNYFGGENFCDAPDITSVRQLHRVQNYVSTLKHAIAGGCQ